MADERPETRHFAKDKDTLIVHKNRNRKKVSLPDEDKSTNLEMEDQRIMLFILGMVERIDMTKTPIVTLGRFDWQSKSDDQLDLTTYGAVDRGVSRNHCKIELKDNQLVITDLDSSNGTYVSGKRLEANEPYTLKKGEELVLGRLPIQVVAGQ